MNEYLMCCGVGKLLSSRDAPQELLGSGAHGNPKSRAQELSERPTSPPNQVASARALGSFCPRPKSSSTRELMGRNTCTAAAMQAFLSCCLAPRRTTMRDATNLLTATPDEAAIIIACVLRESGSW